MKKQDRGPAAPTATLHEVKCWPEYFEAVRDGRKPFELRRNDRNYQVGDTIRLMEYDPLKGRFTGRDDWRLITYVLRGRVGEPKDPISLRAGVASIASPEIDSFSYVILPDWAVLGIATLNFELATAGSASASDGMPAAAASEKEGT